MSERNTDRHGRKFSKKVKRGKRTYFFDVRDTRKGDRLLTITESIRKIDDTGKFIYRKHQIFIYDDCLDEFGQGFEEAAKFIQGESDSQMSEEQDLSDYSSDITFDDLDEEDQEDVDD